VIFNDRGEPLQTLEVEAVAVPGVGGLVQGEEGISSKPNFIKDVPAVPVADVTKPYKRLLIVEETF